MRQHLGPFAGIETALAADYGELNLITGCDMPDLAPEWLEEMVFMARRTRALCVVTEDAAGKDSSVVRGLPERVPAFSSPGARWPAN